MPIIIADVNGPLETPSFLLTDQSKHRDVRPITWVHDWTKLSLTVWTKDCRFKNRKKNKHLLPAKAKTISL